MATASILISGILIPQGEDRWVAELKGVGGEYRLHDCPFGSQLEVAGQLGSLHLLLTPRQLQQLQDLLSAVSLAGEAFGRSRGWMAGRASQVD